MVNVRFNFNAQVGESTYVNCDFTIKIVINMKIIKVNSRILKCVTLLDELKFT